jgi:hypothetical protein
MFCSAVLRTGWPSFRGREWLRFRCRLTIPTAALNPPPPIQAGRRSLAGPSGWPLPLVCRKARGMGRWSDTTWLSPSCGPKSFSTTHPGARPGAHRSRPKPNRQSPTEHPYYSAGLRRCQPCPASPPLPIPTQPIPIQSIPDQPSQNPSQNHPLRLPSNHHSRHSRLLSSRGQPPPRAARGWAWIAKACWRPSPAP